MGAADGKTAAGAAVVSEPGQQGLLGKGHLGDHDVFGRNVLVHAAVVAGLHALDLVDHVHAGGHFTEHAVAEALGGGGLEVQEVVVVHVDEELGAGGVRLHGAGHGDGADLVGQTVGRLVLDGSAGFFLFKARGIAAALDHEAVDDAVEDGVVVVTVTAVLQEVGHGLRGFFRVQGQGDVAVVGVQSNHELSFHFDAGSKVPAGVWHKVVAILAHQGPAA